MKLKIYKFIALVLVAWNCSRCLVSWLAGVLLAQSLAASTLSSIEIICLLSFHENEKDRMNEWKCITENTNNYADERHTEKGVRHWHTHAHTHTQGRRSWVDGTRIRNGFWHWLLSFFTVDKLNLNDTSSICMDTKTFYNENDQNWMFWTFVNLFASVEQNECDNVRKLQNIYLRTKMNL